MFKKSIALFFTGILILGITACEKEEGTMEKAGKRMDNAAASVKKSADNTAKSVKESYEETKDAILDKGPAEKAGERIDDAVENVTEE